MRLLSVVRTRIYLLYEFKAYATMPIERIHIHFSCIVYYIILFSPKEEHLQYIEVQSYKINIFI